LQLLSARPECRTRDGRIVRAVRRVFRTSPEQPRFAFDWQRTVRLAAFGGAIAGPLGHVWFQALDSRVMPATPRRYAAVRRPLQRHNAGIPLVWLSSPAQMMCRCSSCMSIQVSQMQWHWSR
jgi:hypothetical protein